MDESWQKLYDDLKDPNVSKEDKDKIWTFIQNESQRFMEFAYPRIAISDEDKKQIEEMKEKLLKLYVGNGDRYFKDLLGDPMHNEHIVSLKNKKVFISGPMRGYENYNFPKFDRIEKILTDNGIECVNPARISRKFKEVEILNSENKFNEMVRQQQEAEKTCNALLLLDGWQHSKGVMLELKTAIDLDMQILLESDLCNMLRSCQQNTQMRYNTTMKTNELDSCFVQSKEQFDAALKAAAVDVKHAHLANMKPGNEGVIYVPYIPMQIVETDEEREARIKRKRAGKSYAKVKLSNDNPHYRHKRGEIVDKDLTNKRYCLEIETVNTCTKNGSYTLIGVVYPRGYEKIWFNEDELSNFETYDENGELI